jgi:hypothetical protein
LRPADAPAPPSEPTPDEAAAARFRETPVRRTVPVPGASGGTSTHSQVAQADILRVISNNRNAIKNCYQRALIHDSTLVRGKINVHISIGISGRVKNVAMDGPPAFRVLEPCVRDVVLHWNFPASSDEYETEFPFVFQGNE